MSKTNDDRPYVIRRVTVSDTSTNEWWCGDQSTWLPDLRWATRFSRYRAGQLANSPGESAHPLRLLSTAYSRCAVCCKPMEHGGDYACHSTADITPVHRGLCFTAYQDAQAAFYRVTKPATPGATIGESYVVEIRAALGVTGNERLVSAARRVVAERDALKIKLDNALSVHVPPEGDHRVGIILGWSGAENVWDAAHRVVKERNEHIARVVTLRDERDALRATIANAETNLLKGIAGGWIVETRDILGMTGSVETIPQAARRVVDRVTVLEGSLAQSLKNEAMANAGLINLRVEFNTRGHQVRELEARLADSHSATVTSNVRRILGNSGTLVEAAQWVVNDRDSWKRSSETAMGKLADAERERDLTALGRSAAQEQSKRNYEACEVLRQQLKDVVSLRELFLSERNEARAKLADAEDKLAKWEAAEAITGPIVSRAREILGQISWDNIDDAAQKMKDRAEAAEKALALAEKTHTGPSWRAMAKDLDTMIEDRNRWKVDACDLRDKLALAKLSLTAARGMRAEAVAERGSYKAQDTCAHGTAARDAARKERDVALGKAASWEDQSNRNLHRCEELSRDAKAANERADNGERQRDIAFADAHRAEAKLSDLRGKLGELAGATK